MKTIGIIAEFNPFHNGHRYLIEEARKKTGADYCIVVMSGDFVQRGAPAMTDKYTRSRMALLNGADLILELPVCYAVGSAEYFAKGAVTLLDQIGVTQTLVFGSECGDIVPLLEAARLLSREEPGFQALLRENLRKGLSFPAARLKSLQQDEKKGTSCLPSGILDSPNNILGIEYCKALLKRNSSIIPMTILRKGAGYHDDRLPDDLCSIKTFPSATALRNILETGGTVKNIAYSVPQNILPLLAHLKPGRLPVCEEDFSLLLHYKLLLDAPSGFTKYLDINEALSDKILKNLNSFTGYRDFIQTLKSKDLTFSRISRCLLHVLLDITDADIAGHEADDTIYYARMLGFRKASGELLHAIKHHTSIPLLSKLADAEALLTPNGRQMLNKDIQAAHLYDMISSAKYGTTLTNEYTRRICTV